MYRLKRKVKVNGVVRTVHCMVIPEKRMVKAYINGCAMDAIEGFVRDTGFAPLEPARFLMNDSYTCTVECHPEDEFDGEIGADIAAQKVGCNYCAAYDRKIVAMLDYMEDHVTDARWRVKNR